MKINAIVAQFPVTLSIPHNIAQIEAVLAQTNPADWVLFPEGAVSGYSTDPTFLKQMDLPMLEAGLNHLRQRAVDRKINVWAGACVQQAGGWFNAAYGFLADGSTQVYHKINLANHERGIFDTGNQLPVFEVATPAGKARVGVQICRELRYPEQWGWLARSGAQIFLHLNNAVGAAHLQLVWRSHLVSRAAETQRFVLSANNAAPEQICPSMAVAPNGQTLGEIVSAGVAFFRLELDLSGISNWNLDQCRTDVVSIQTNR